MKLKETQNILCDSLKYQFKDPNLLLSALTHSSLNNPNKSDNQRLEFLGDRVLALIIAEELINSNPEAREGKLAPQLNSLVSKETCAEIAAALGVGAALMIGKSEMISGGRSKAAILADAMEAIIAAIYLDGGLESVREFILQAWQEKLAMAPSTSFEAKSYLQEWAQARGMSPPTYIEVERSGPDHAPIFKIKVLMENGEFAYGQGSAKRVAQQDAAKNFLDKIKN
ncbi:MAG: ribonuclease III [Pseudomonadota bacterium]|nr:ribonuclease III [Pseudomonadota bacterium]